MNQQPFNHHLNASSRKKSNVLLFRPMQVEGKSHRVKETKIYKFGEFTVNPMHRQLIDAGGKAVSLTPKTFDLLLVLVESGGQILTKDELMSTVWHDSFVEEANLAQTISMLRKVLGETRGENRFIVTVPGHGYRFAANVEEVFEDEVKREPLTLVESETAKSISDFHTEKESKVEENTVNDRKWYLPALIGLGILLCATLAFVFFNRSTEPKSVSEIKSIAILPFKNIGGKADEEYLGQGLSEVLITKLSSIRTIVVRPTSSVLRYKDASPDPKKIGNELNVDAVVIGRVQKIDENIRVTVQLVRVSDGATLWAETFDDKYTNIFAVQDSIAEQVANSLALTLTTGERQQIAKRLTTNTEAYQLYLQGRYFWNKRTGEDMKKAIEFFNQAINIDPDFARAYLGLADCYALMPLYMGKPADEGFPKAIEYANKALQIDENLPEAHATLGHIYYHSAKPEEAEREFKRAIEMNPNYPTAHHWYSRFLRAVNRSDEALAEIKKAKELDPVSVVIMVNVAQIYKERGDYDAAIEELRKALSFDPNFAITHDELARVYLKKGLNAEALLESQKAVEFSNRSHHPLLITLGEVHIQLGQRNEALAIIKELEERYPSAASYYIAYLYSLLGQRKQVFKWLEITIKEKHIDLINLKEDPNFTSFLADPRFQEMLKELKLNN